MIKPRYRIGEDIFQVLQWIPVQDPHPNPASKDDEDEVIQHEEWMIFLHL